MRTSALKLFTLSVCALCIQGIMAQNRAPEQIELKEWSFSKDQQNWEKVTVPHSCNAIDGHSTKYYRGKAYYRRDLEVSKKELNQPMYILFEGAAQAATLTVNGKFITKHMGGYTPFLEKLNEYLKTGTNKIEVCTDNTLDVNLIPVSSDFNKNNGLHNPVYLLKTGEIFLSPRWYGMYRMHVSTPRVSRDKAEVRIISSVDNYSNKKQNLKVEFLFKDHEGNIVDKTDMDIKAPKNGNYGVSCGFEVVNPHLWDGVNDPYLYTAEVRVLNSKGKEIDKAETKVGLRFYETTENDGFYLNGHPYPLRGVSEHQDWDGQASAVTKDHTYKDYEIIKELGANFVRLAHYPHNDYEFRLCDSLGIVVQTEIPWVNVCGENASNAYFDIINQQMREMITNLYNHPSIIFWGMWNEVDSWGNTKEFQGKIDYVKVLSETATLYKNAKRLDPYRYVGLTDCCLLKRGGYEYLLADFISENRYPDWYQLGGTDRLYKEMTEAHQKRKIMNIAEYGGGVNPFCHTLDSVAMKDRKDDSKHYEEYGCYIHESDLRQILKMPWLNFTSLWIMFDFPVADRKEGYMDSGDGVTFTANENRKYMNDKGLVTRDRKIKKDHFYLYKSLWNKKETTVYITGRRRTGSPKDQPFNVKVYSNANSLSLYQNGELVQKLDKCPDSTGVIWTFDAVKYKTDSDKFKVVSDNGTTDEVEWKAL